MLRNLVRGLSAGTLLLFSFQWVSCWAVFLTILTTLCPAQIPQGDIAIKLESLVSFSPPFPNEVSPADLIPLDDGTERMLLAMLGGTVRVVSPTENGGFDLLGDPLLSRSQTGGSFIGESGTSSIAIHPDFSNSSTFGYGKFYILSAEPPDSGIADFANPGADNHQAVVREWDISAIVGNGNVNSLPTLATSDSREVLRIDRPGPFHGVYELLFDDDRSLFITSGDGGQQFDPNRRAQNRSNIYGTILRIDPDTTAHDLVRTSANTLLPAYSVPDDNPFNGDDVVETRLNSLPEGSETVTLAEIYAYGIRSPWRLTIDRGDATGDGRGDLYLGDVGQNDWEEVSRIYVRDNSAVNLGWPYREGRHDGPQISDAPPDFVSSDPVFELSHDDGEGFTVVGGFVYRGAAIPELQGQYVFAELGQDSGSRGSSPVPHARLYYGDPNGDGTFFSFDLSRSVELYNVVTGSGSPSLAKLPERIISIGEDLDGELYLVATAVDPRQGGGADARIIRILQAPRPGDLDGDGLVSIGDWTLFKAGQGADFSGLNSRESYLLGDLDGDFDHDLVDYREFRILFESANGADSFAAMLAGAPEPNTVSLGAFVSLFLLLSRRPSWSGSEDRPGLETRNN